MHRQTISCKSRDDRTQTDQQPSQDYSQNTLPSGAVKMRQQAIQDRTHIKGRPLMSTKYHSESENPGSRLKCPNMLHLH